MLIVLISRHTLFLLRPGSSSRTGRPAERVRLEAQRSQSIPARRIRRRKFTNADSSELGGRISFLAFKIVDDPSGDSFVENPDAPKKDPSLAVSFYTRTPEQCEMLGMTVRLFLVARSRS